MGTRVYANGKKIACKASDGKSVAQFPDVCMTPPTAPPTPSGVPVPYPNTAMAKDCEKGSKRVKIGGKPVMLRDRSYIASSTGNEAGSAPQKNVVTRTNRGKAYFTGWSVNVRFEGQNVPRHLDPMTHNHASQPGDGGPWVYMDLTDDPPGLPSDKRCTLTTYTKGKGENGCKTIGDHMTPHHCVPDHCFKEKSDGPYYEGAVEHRDGLCICVEGSDKYRKKETNESISHWSYELWSEHYAALAEHGRIHAKFDEYETQLGSKSRPKGTTTLGKLEETAAMVIAQVTGCDEDHLQKQLRAYHKSKGLPRTTRLRADPHGSRPNPPPQRMGLARKSG
ncbi:DUF4150 domain-containing protein [Pseudenhygromyxa sp. WMMC2535]|uniref:PAAR-like domain-containing protein n=1 Tax=Pseudenhygromyxa sp. WMMC2535 TaxID=2712867 RepID=UPI0015580475|nr:PAAR-like domain-containing protein [Pseudenhygromyxa sp. WMMC2535]NVB38751.1 DUF4150 domain-containing protein [Pseudenhygromyxa sp. WMMC2535]